MIADAAVIYCVPVGAALEPSDTYYRHVLEFNGINLPVNLFSLVLLMQMNMWSLSKSLLSFYSLYI